MTAVLSRNNVQTALEESAFAAETPTLHVRREDIAFTTLPGDRVAITVRVENRGRRRTRETVALLQAAPLGAFVPWRPLTTLLVPSLAPGESVELQAEARRPRPAVLGDASRVPPQRLLTALANEDDRERARPAQPVLPSDLMDLMGRANPHWAGNLNIFIGGRAVERHMAQALRVYPGRLNLALFVVGSGRDAYAFDLHGTAAEWGAALYAMNDVRALTELRPTSTVPVGEWVEVAAQTFMILALQPPRDCPAGSVEVHVRQQSTGQEAVVEFSLDPAAAGPGCYTL
jgi:hypothetical protein